MPAWKSGRASGNGWRNIDHRGAVREQARSYRVAPAFPCRSAPCARWRTRSALARAVAPWQSLSPALSLKGEGAVRHCGKSPSQPIGSELSCHSGSVPSPRRERGTFGVVRRRRVSRLAPSCHAAPDQSLSEREPFGVAGRRRVSRQAPNCHAAPYQSPLPSGRGLGRGTSSARNTGIHVAPTGARRPACRHPATRRRRSHPGGCNDPDSPAPRRARLRRR